MFFYRSLFTKNTLRHKKVLLTENNGNIPYYTQIIRADEKSPYGVELCTSYDYRIFFSLYSRRCFNVYRVNGALVTFLRSKPIKEDTCSFEDGQDDFFEASSKRESRDKLRKHAQKNAT